jgi:hypothetical protein
MRGLWVGRGRDVGLCEVTHEEIQCRRWRRRTRRMGLSRAMAAHAAHGCVCMCVCVCVCVCACVCVCVCVRERESFMYARRSPCGGRFCFCDSKTLRALVPESLHVWFVHVWFVHANMLCPCLVCACEHCSSRDSGGEDSREGTYGWLACAAEAEQESEKEQGEPHQGGCEGERGVRARRRIGSRKTEHETVS